MKTESEIKTLVLTAICTVADAGSMGLPSGHLYAAMMDKCSLSEYEDIVGLLDKSGLIRNRVGSLVLYPTTKCLDAAKQIAALLVIGTSLLVTPSHNIRPDSSETK